MSFSNKNFGLSDSLIDAVKNVFKEETEYQKFFKGALKKFGVSSPAQLKGAKEKEFYDYVDKNWKGKDEKAEEETKLSGKKEKITLNPKLEEEESNEEKVECPKCKGKGCDHCDGTGYHEVEEAANPAQQAAIAIAKKKSGKYDEDGKKINEKLKVSDGLGAWIEDFLKSDAPQFKGKTDEKKKQMAVAAFIDAGGKLDESFLAEEPAEEKPMMISQVKAMIHFLEGIMSYVQNSADPEEWYQNKLTKAHSQLSSLYSHATGTQMSESVETTPESLYEAANMLAVELEERWEVNSGKHAIGSLSYDDKEIINIDKKTAAKLQAYFKKTKDGKAWREIFQGKGKGKDSVEDQKSFDAYVKKLLGEEVELEEAKAGKYKLYHMSYSGAIQAALTMAKEEGYEVDMDDYERKVAMGPRKPSSGKTNSFSIKLSKNGKPVRQALQIQVYNMDNKKYELNTYIS